MIVRYQSISVVAPKDISGTEICAEHSGLRELENLSANDIGVCFKSLTANVSNYCPPLSTERNNRIFSLFHDELYTGRTAERTVLIIWSVYSFEGSRRLGCTESQWFSAELSDVIHKDNQKLISEEVQQKKQMLIPATK